MKESVLKMYIEASGGPCVVRHDNEINLNAKYVAKTRMTSAENRTYTTLRRFENSKIRRMLTDLIT